MWPRGFALPVWMKRAPLAVIHPAAAFATKQWATEKFARVAEELSARGLRVVAITAPTEAHIADELEAELGGAR